MKEILSIQTVVIVSLFAVLLAADAFLVDRMSYAEAGTIGLNTTSFQDVAERLTDLAEKKGAAYAFEVLKRADLPPNLDLHLLGHEVGNILYKQRGISGITDCTQDFRNSCSHSIVIGALNEFNASDETFRLIDEACHEAPGGTGAYTMCYHGLGHGVFAYVGYDLESTLVLCKKMGTPEYHNEQYTQCVGGAVMELMGGGGHDQKKWLAAREKYLPSDRPLAPCDSGVIPDSAKAFCYIYLTPRLLEFAGVQLASPSPATFSQAFSFCDAIPASEQYSRNSCFGGFGKEFIPLVGVRDVRKVDQFSDGQYALAIYWCLLAEADDGKKACIEEALESVFWGGETDPRASFRFCSVVPAEFADSCFYRLGEVIGRYFEGEERSAWCDNLKPVFRDSCRGKIL